jgi:dimeric dUTPase (all-alpha-NTP-PPase superfamily)
MGDLTIIPSPTARDKLELLFREQMLLTQEIERIRNKMQDIYKTPEVFKGYRIFMLSSAILHEVIELQAETSWKWWKTPKEISMEKCQQEVIDIWHFLIQLSIELGMDANTIVSRYLQKHKENINRQKEGY